MVLHITNHTGDTQVAVEEDVDLATELFNKAVGEGKVAFAKGKGAGYQVSSLDEAAQKEADRVVMIGPFAGG